MTTRIAKLKKVVSHRIKDLSESARFLPEVVKILEKSGKGYIIGIVILAILFGVIPSLSVIVMQEIVNTLQVGNQSLSYIILLIAFYISIDALGSLLGLISTHIENNLQLKAAVTLNASILEKTKDLSIKDFEDSETYNLIQRAKNIGIVQFFAFFKSTILIFQSLINMIMFSIILFAFRWWMVLVIFVVPIINALITAFFSKKEFFIQRNRTNEERKKWYFEFLLTNDIAFKEIKIFNIGHYFRREYQKLAINFLKQDKNLLSQRTFSNVFILILDQTLSSLLLIYVILRAFFGKILLGDMITYTRSISNVKSSAEQVLLQVNSLYQTSLYISQYFEFINMNPSVQSKEIKYPITELPFIKIKNLSYQYNGIPALKKVNLILNKGQLVALIGKNGSGKTTLVKILSTLYKDYEGDIYFGKENLGNLSDDNVSDQIGILFQDFVKYELSARENIALGQLEKIKDDQSLREVLAKTGMNKKISDLDSQLGFWFDEGIQLSEGQWLKIALSRAFIRDAKLFLLDEPNAALDPVSERQILKSFKTLCADRIGIIISHRISSIKDIVDEIIVLDQGSIVSKGVHHDLLISCPIYQELYRSEKGEEDE